MESTSIVEMVSWGELSRLLTIVASSASIALAGQVAQTETLEPVQVAAEQATAKLLATPESSTTQGPVVITDFASTEIQTLSELHDALTERAEFLPEGAEPSDGSIKKALLDLDESLMLARHALTKYKADPSSSSFLKENLKSQIFRLQEDARNAQILFLSRESSQSFNISRTGQ